jgi:hypothetical protein
MIGRSGAVFPLLQMKARGKWRGGHGRKVGAKIYKACRKAYYLRPVTSFETFRLQNDFKPTRLPRKRRAVCVSYMVCKAIIALPHLCLKPTTIQAIKGEVFPYCIKMLNAGPKGLRIEFQFVDGDFSPRTVPGKP